MLMVILVYRHESTNQCTKHMEWYKNGVAHELLPYLQYTTVTHDIANSEESLTNTLFVHLNILETRSVVLFLPRQFLRSILWSLRLANKQIPKQWKANAFAPFRENFHSWKGQNAQNQIKKLQRTNTTWKLTTTIKHYLQFRCVSIN